MLMKIYINQWCLMMTMMISRTHIAGNKEWYNVANNKLFFLQYIVWKTYVT